MNKSVLLRRILSLVMLTILLITIFTALLFNILSRNLFSNLKVSELRPKAEAISSLVLRMRKGELDFSTLDIFLNTGNAFIDANAMIIDSHGTLIATNNHRFTKDDIDSVIQSMPELLSGQEAVYTGRFKGRGFGSNIDVVCVGHPIIESNVVVGAVILYKPMIETIAALATLNGVLLLAVSIVLLIMVFPAYAAAIAIIKPLRQMQSIAMGMVGGDFSVRADETQKGEIGQFAKSINYLASELSRTISALVVERNSLKQILYGISEGIVAVDTLGNITQYNPAVGHLFTASYLKHDDIRMSLIPHASIWEDFDRTLSQNTAINRNMRQDNSILRISITPLQDEDGTVLGAVGLFRDVTESERLEQTRRDYVANVSHEMRTPLTAMRGLVEPLRDGLVKSEEDKLRYYSIMLRETMRLSRLIDDLMELSRLQSGNFALEIQPINIGELLTDIFNKYQNAAEDNDIELKLNLCEEEFSLVLGNEDRVEQVLVILLDNAIKYTNSGGCVTLSAKYDNERATIFVADTGIGISADDQKYVFDRFYKADKSRSGMGSGLGLSIAKEILLHMGESIDVKSQLGEGSTFFFTLKRAK